MADLTSKQDKALQALLAQNTITAAAKAAGVGERTLYRWLDDPDFSAAYRHARRQVMQHTISRLQQASTHATTVLLMIMADKTVSPGVRLRAAVSVLEVAIKSVELEDLQQRIEALEAALEVQHGDGAYPFR